MPSLPIVANVSSVVTQQIEALSSRDRKILVGLAGSVAVLFVGGFVYLSKGMLERQAAEVRRAKERVVEVQQLQQTYQEAELAFKSQEARLKSRQPVSTFVEGLARKHDMADQLATINALGNPELVGGIAQQRYQVEIRKAPQENIYRFLHELETSGYPASVQEASFKSQATKDGLMMTMTLDLLVLSAGEG